MTAPWTSDDAFLAAFESGTLAPESFHHRDHVRAAWLLLRRSGPLEALARLTTGLRRLAAAAGKADRYHETMTWAYVLLVHERMEDGEGFEEFASRHPDLLDRSAHVLERYYRAATLRSERARRKFVLPDGGRASDRG